MWECDHLAIFLPSSLETERESLNSRVLQRTWTLEYESFQSSRCFKTKASNFSYSHTFRQNNKETHELYKQDIFASPWEFQSHRLFVIHQALIIERRFEDFSTPRGHVLHLFLPFCCIVSKGHWSSLPQKLPWLLSNITISSLNMLKRSLFQLLCTNIRQRLITFGANCKNQPY